MKFNCKINFKNIFLFFSLIFISLYLPLSFTIYSNSFYQYNFENQNTYKLISKDISINATNNLINFFLHKKELNLNWNEKEKIHMLDVRNIYDILFFIFLSSIFFFLIFFKKLGIKKLLKKLNKFSKINIYIISTFILLIPIFNFFWNKIFHLIFFNNNLWIITKQDISYYLFEISFFINSLILIIIFSVLFNLIIYFLSKKLLTSNNVK